MYWIQTFGIVTDSSTQSNFGTICALVSPSAATEDYWQKIGNKLIRLHVTPRRKLFYPSDLSLKHLLAPGEELTGNRITVMTAVTDKARKETLQHDLQTAHSTQQSTVGYWTGKTIFTVKLNFCNHRWTTTWTCTSRNFTTDHHHGADCTGTAKTSRQVACRRFLF